jgi:hypothetical protein
MVPNLTIKKPSAGNRQQNDKLLIESSRIFSNSMGLVPHNFVKFLNVGFGRYAMPVKKFERVRDVFKQHLNLAQDKGMGNT